MKDGIKHAEEEKIITKEELIEFELYKATLQALAEASRNQKER